jgi:hypothetical protein
VRCPAPVMPFRLRCSVGDLLLHSVGPVSEGLRPDISLPHWLCTTTSSGVASRNTYWYNSRMHQPRPRQPAGAFPPKPSTVASRGFRTSGISETNSALLSPNRASPFSWLNFEQIDQFLINLIKFRTDCSKSRQNYFAIHSK